jgi:hypothetical protein
MKMMTSKLFYYIIYIAHKYRMISCLSDKKGHYINEMRLNCLEVKKNGSALVN